MKRSVYIFLPCLFLCLLTGCTFPLWCFLRFPDYTKTYHFNFSKEELKNQVVAAYTYDKSLFRKNLGMTLIGSAGVNNTYSTSATMWLDRKSWDQYKAEIRQNTTDTLHIIIGKWHSGRRILLQAIIQGDKDTSSLTIRGFDFRRGKACDRDRKYYVVAISEKIEKKFINKLK